MEICNIRTTSSAIRVDLRKILLYIKESCLVPHVSPQALLAQGEVFVGISAFCFRIILTEHKYLLLLVLIFMNTGRTVKCYRSAPLT